MQYGTQENSFWYQTSLTNAGRKFSETKRQAEVRIERRDNYVICTLHCDTVM